MEKNLQQSQKKSPRNGGRDAVALLMADHQEVARMFKDFEKLSKADAADASKEALVKKICDALNIHTTVEEEIFYPAAREAIDDEDLMDEADVEHGSAKELIRQLESMRAGDDHYDAKVTVLGEQIDHHVKDEHESMFPKAKKAKLDLVELGEQIAQRKNELKGGCSSRAPTEAACQRILGGGGVASR